MNRYFLSTKLFLPVLAAAAMLLVVGCGDDADSEDGGFTGVTVETGSLSKAQFIKQADAICSEAVEKVQDGGEAVSRKIQSADSLQAGRKAEMPKFVANLVVPTFEEQIDRVSSLGAPSGDEQQIAVMLETLQQGLVTAEKQPLTFVTSGSFAKAARLGQAYGFAYCGKL